MHRISSILLAVLILGCAPATIHRLEIVQIGEVRLHSIDAEAIQLSVALDVQNPYSLSARIKDLFFEAGVGGGFIGKGSMSGSTDLPSHAVVSLEIPVAIRCADVAQRDFDTLFQSSIPYQIRGFATLEKPFRRSKIEIDANGSVKTPSPLILVLEGNSVQSIVSLPDSTIRELIALIRSGSIALEVKNPFSFPVSLKRFEYEISFGRDAFAKGNSAEATILRPGINRINVPVRPRPTGVLETLLRTVLDQRVPHLNLSAILTLQHADRELTLKLVH